GAAICSWAHRKDRPRAAGNGSIRAVSPLAEATEEADHRTARAGGGARALLPAPTDPNGQNHGDAIAAGVACTAEQAVPWASPPSPHPVPGPIAVMRTPCTARVSVPRRLHGTRHPLTTVPAPPCRPSRRRAFPGSAARCPGAAVHAAAAGVRRLPRRLPSREARAEHADGGPPLLQGGR